jgi:hypothetical protein
MQYVDCCPWVMFIHKPIREGCVPLPLGLATYCTLTDCSGGLKGGGRRCEIRHAGRVLSMDEAGLRIKTDVGWPRVIHVTLVVVHSCNEIFTDDCASTATPVSGSSTKFGITVKPPISTRSLDLVGHRG